MIEFTRIDIVYILINYFTTIHPRTMSTHALILLSILLVLTHCDPQPKHMEVVGRVVEVQPVALDVLLSIYDRSVVLFTEEISASLTQMFETSIKRIIAGSEESKFNKTIFAVCDITKDQSGKLRKFGGRQGIQLITPLTHYELKLPDDKNQLPQFFDVQFPAFVSLYTSSKPSLIDPQDVKTPPFNDGFLLLISPSNEEEAAKLQVIHQKIFDYLKFFNLSFGVNKFYTTHAKAELYYQGELYSTYASSAVQALLNFTADPDKNEISDLVDYINVETISSVTFLEDSNYFRVFGSSIESQMLLVYREKDAENEQIQRILHQYEKAAVANRNEGLKYERVLFAVGTSQFLADYFADQVLHSTDLFSIIITKTDYSSFQLRKYLYLEKQVTAEKLTQFIEEVRLKKVDPHYKSEEIEENEGRKIRKIVGNNFYKEIFQQAEKSVMVLFFDSKDSTSSNSLREALQSFVQKYEQAYAERMNVGVFDLAKNQHKSLTISTAPELILFERSNKKKAKFFKGAPTKESILNWVNYEAKDFTIPENFGEPPIALGSANTQL